MSRKKNERIEGLGKIPEQKLIVQKSNPLVSLWQSDMTLAEFKILDTYLSRINSRDPDNRTVIFTKGELEKLLGVKKIKKADLVKRLSNLYRGIEIEKGDSGIIHTIALFEEAYGGIDENGIWSIQLTCSAPAMKYIFNIDKLGYLRYKIRSITSITSRYTYILFLYLEKNRYRKSWEEDVDTLRMYLRCDNDESYSAFKVFNDRILKRCQKELDEKSDCKFEYTPIKKGRKVVAVSFTVKSIKDLYPDDPGQIEGQMNIDELMEQEEESPEMWHGAVKEFNFSKEQLNEIQENLVLIPDHVLPQAAASYDNIYIRRYHYIRLKVAEIKRRDKSSPIRSKYAYLLKMLKSDQKSQSDENY